jgi:hypothetical protein
MINKQIAKSKFATNATRITNHKNLPKTFMQTRPKSFYTLDSSDASHSSSSLKNSICYGFALC